MRVSSVVLERDRTGLDGQDGRDDDVVSSALVVVSSLLLLQLLLFKTKKSLHLNRCLQERERSAMRT